MQKYQSGLSYGALKKAADNNAISTLSRGGFRKNGKRLQCVLTYKDGAGKRCYLAHTIDGTKASGRGSTGANAREKILREWRAQVVEDVKSVAGIHDDPTVSVADAVRLFIDGKDVRDSDGNPVGVRLSTLSFYRYCAKRLDVLPRLASMPLKDVTEDDIREWVFAMAAGRSAKPYTRKTIKDSLNVLSQTFDAYKLPNPCRGVAIPKNAARSKRGDGSTKPNALNKDGIMRLNTLMDLRESKAEGIDCVMLGARIALHTGMRAEEISGLRWSCVDLSNRKILIRNVIERSTVQVSDGDGGTKVEYREYDAPPKSEKSRRDVPIDDVLFGVLTDVRTRVAAMVRAEHPRMKDASIEKQIRSMYVVTKTVTGEDGKTEFRHYSPHRLSDNFRDWARRVGLDGTEGPIDGLHALRHTWATIAIQEGQPISEVANILGHSKPTTTLNIYVGRDEDLQRVIVDSMASVFGARLPEDVGMLGAASA